MFLFPEALLEGKIIERKNRFIMFVQLNDEIVECHSSTTGKIGNLILNNLPCLLSKSASEKRKTQYTVEAIALNRYEDKVRHWIGINQIQINRYLEHYFQMNAFPKMLYIEHIKREALFKQSRLDFLLNEKIYLEIKTPLHQLNCPIPDFIPFYPKGKPWIVDRLSKHLEDLGSACEENGRAIMMLAFIYNAPAFDRLSQAKNSNVNDLMEQVQKLETMGLEFWQVNLQINPLGVELLNYFKLD